MILGDPGTVSNPFFLLAPTWATLPLVVLATVATVIASQAVISGAFSVSRQAVRLGMLPRLAVRHTSREEGGQIYVPVMNWILFVGVLLLTATFRSSSRLAAAYGLAVTGTLLLTSALFLLLARHVWQGPDVEARRLRRPRRRRRADLPRRQPHQGRQPAAGCPSSSPPWSSPS